MNADFLLACAHPSQSGLHPQTKINFSTTPRTGCVNLTALSHIRW